MTSFFSLSSVLLFGSSTFQVQPCVTKYDSPRLGTLNIKICLKETVNPLTKLVYITAFRHKITNISGDVVFLFLEKNRLRQSNIFLFEGKDLIFGMPEFVKEDDVYGLSLDFKKIQLKPSESIFFELKMREFLPVLKQRKFGDQPIYQLSFSNDFAFLRKGESGDVRNAFVLRMEESNRLKIWQKPLFIGNARIR